MDSLEQIPYVYYILASIVAIITIFTYIKNLFGLKIKVNRLGYNIKQFFVFISLLPRLRKVSEENSQNFSSMIDFNIDYSIFQNGTYPFVDTIVSNPYFQFRYSITNHSIYDFKIDKIDMQILYQNDKLGSPITEEGLDLPHQRTIFSEAKLEKLHSNFINKLKIEKKEKEKLFFNIDNIKIYFIRDKKFHKDIGNFQLEIPINRMRISQ